jgi:hypothetical protein
MAAFARNLGWAGIGTDQELVRSGDRIHRCQQYMRPDIAGDKIDIILFNQLVRFLLADVGLETIVFHDQFDIELAHLVSDMLKRKHDRIFHVFSDYPGRSSQRSDESDFDTVSLGDTGDAYRAGD